MDHMRQIICFGIVGLCASLVHFGIAIFLIHALFNPHIANLIAFCIAFQVSFWSHFHWSFSNNRTHVRQAMKRFFIVAISGFALNETLFFIGLSLDILSSGVLLLLIIGVVAIITFMLSKFWAFSG